MCQGLKKKRLLFPNVKMSKNKQFFFSFATATKRKFQFEKLFYKSPIQVIWVGYPVIDKITLKLGTSLSTMSCTHA